MAAVDTRNQEMRVPPMVIALRMKVVFWAANSLTQDGFTILHLEPNVLSAKPVIWIVNSPRLKTLIETNHAEYYRSGIDEFGHYRVGQFDRLGAAVKWIERGH